MGLKENMMENMMKGMSAEEKKQMMNSMMESFLGGMSEDEKKAMMNEMMPRMMGSMMGGAGGGSGGGMMGSMMSMMGGLRREGWFQSDGHVQDHDGQHVKNKRNGYLCDSGNSNAVRGVGSPDRGRNSFVYPKIGNYRSGGSFSAV